MTNSFEITLLAKRHNRVEFTCGVESLDKYLHIQAGQDTRRDVASVYVMTEQDEQRVVGFYTLSAYFSRFQTFR